ncbi:MAG: hypothetical protein OXC46_11725 [Thaumarchaeota archaeon]|nr:hypothetical protein [Nitrososphaerota archaeon]
MSEKENSGIGGTIESKIVSLVHNTQGISKKEIIQGIEKSKMASHNTVIKQIEKMLKDGIICERRISGRKNYEYFTPNYIDVNIEEQLENNFENLYKMFQDVEKESEKYDHQLKRKVNEHIEHLLFKTPREINDWKDYFKSQQVSELSGIREDTKNMIKLLDESFEKKNHSLVTHQKLTSVIHRMRNDLCKMDCQRIKFIIQKQKARLAEQRSVINDKLASLENDWDKHYTEWCKLESKIKENDLNNTYVKYLVGMYLRKKSDTIQKIQAMLYKMNIQVRHKLEEPFLKICHARDYSIREEKSLCAELEEAIDRDVYDDKKEKIRMEQTKTRYCEKIIDTIFRRLKSDTSINDILAEIPEEYRQTT